MKSRLNHSRVAAFVITLGSLTPLAVAQDFNVDFSTDGVVVPPSFAAAGSAGAWNAAAPPFGGLGAALVDTAGNATSASMLLLTPTAVFTSADPAVTGDPATLLLDGFGATDVVQAMRVQGLTPGTYDLIVYGFVPGAPSWSTTFIMPPGIDLISGAYPGGFAEGVTHDRVTTDVGANGMLRIDWVSGFFGGSGFFSGFQLELVDFGTNYCSATANSTGSAAEMSVSGSASIADANLELSAGPVPDEPYVFYAGPNQISAPFGDGVRCVGGTVVRFWPPQLASGNVASRTIDPAAFGLIPGSWNVQCWFRDPAAMGTGFNLSDGSEITLVP